MVNNQLTKAKEGSLEDTFNIVEYATKYKAKDGVDKWNRHYFSIKGDSFPINVKTNHYRSHFLHSVEIEEYYKSHKTDNGKNTLAGYDGAVWIDDVVFDIDNSDDLNESLSTLRNFLKSLESTYEVNLSHLKVNYSGSKGFHVRIPATLFGGFEPSQNLPNLIHEIMSKLTDGFKYFDSSIYDRLRPIRIVNSIHGSTNRYAIALTIQEVFTLSTDQIIELSGKPKVVQYIEIDELEPFPKLAELKGATQKNLPEKKSKELKPVIPVNVGERHMTLLSLVVKLCSINEKLVDITRFALEWNKYNSPQMDEDELKLKVEEMYDSHWNRASFFKIDDKDDLKINIFDYIKTLEHFGFAKYYIEKNFILIHNNNNCLDEVKTSHIKDFVRNNLEKVKNGNRAYSKMLDSGSKYFGEELLEHLKAKNENMIRDTKDTCHFFFKNHIVQVGGEGQIKYIPYSESNGLIWKNQLINRDFKVTKEKGDFEKFTFNVVGLDEHRFNSLKSVIGYLLHTYKNPSFAKAVILCDGKISEDPVGRTGKSRIGEAIGKLRKRIYVNGKSFNADDKFSFQQVELGSQLLDYNDVRKNFPFERLFSIITEDMTTERKRKDAITIPFADSPKILISTNFTIKGVGDSYRDRMIEVEFTDHYNADHKPVDDFGKLFFDEWDGEEWSRFDNFMVECAVCYLKNGIIKSTPINTIKKKIMEITGEDFYDFASNTIETGTEYIKSKVHGEFILKYPSSKNVSIRSFGSYLKTYSNYMNLVYIERPSNGNQIIKLEKK